MLKRNVTDCFGPRIRELLTTYDWQDISEIRLRIGRPLILRSGAKEYFVGSGGLPTGGIQNAYRASQSDLKETVNMISNYSLYAVQEQLKFGYITVEGGHRAALGGSTVCENGKITCIKNISSVSMRVACERKGCAAEAVKYVIGEPIKNTLIVSPVCGGKTTMLRDMLRILSDGGLTVGISDERGEIAACYEGMPQLDVGERTDVLDCCPKAEGMSMLVRNMSPDIAAADEIGSKEDIRAMREAALSGTAVICTAHGTGFDDIIKRLPEVADFFDVFIILEGRNSPGKIKKILNSRGEALCL